MSNPIRDYIQHFRDTLDEPVERDPEGYAMLAALMQREGNTQAAASAMQAAFLAEELEAAERRIVELLAKYEPVTW